MSTNGAPESWEDADDQNLANKLNQVRIKAIPQTDG